MPTCSACGRELTEDEHDLCWPCAFDEAQELAVIAGAETPQERRERDH